MREISLMGFLSSLFADRKCDKKRRASRAASRNRLSSALKPLKLIGESLERRELLAIFTWDGGGADNMWMTGANWVGDVAPSAIDPTTRNDITKSRLRDGIDAAKSLRRSNTIALAGSGFDPPPNLIRHSRHDSAWLVHYRATGNPILGFHQLTQ